MAIIEQLCNDLQGTLAHLDDPRFEPPHLLCRVTGCLPQDRAKLRSILIEAIRNLSAGNDLVPGMRLQRISAILTQRYLEQRTQEETAELLGISPRHVRREQRRAVEIIAEQLWERRPIKQAQPDEGAPDAAVSHTIAGPFDRSVAWHSQVKEEIALLSQEASDRVAHIAEDTVAVLELLQPLARERDVALSCEETCTGVVAAIHPSAFRQVMINALTTLLKDLHGGDITLALRPLDDRVQITLTAKPIHEWVYPTDYLGTQLLVAQGGSIQVHHESPSLVATLLIPLVDKITILVVDDNADMVHIYKRYVGGTRYRVVHVDQGTRLFEAIKQHDPQIVVLDVMLQDIDGWELLSLLREHPTASVIPVIICSVVRERELALSLGATEFLTKPILRQQFLHALDQAAIASREA